MIGKRILDNEAANLGFEIKKFLSDNGIFVSAEFKGDLTRRNQTLRLSGVGAHHQNGPIIIEDHYDDIEVLKVIPGPEPSGIPIKRERQVKFKEDPTTLQSPSRSPPIPLLEQVVNTENQGRGKRIRKPNPHIFHKDYEFLAMNDSVGASRRHPSCKSVN